MRHYIPTLDGWRAIAIALVLFCHLRLPRDLLAAVSPYGAVGVDLFFAISGFLITSRLLQEREISWKAFYLRRFFRIIPPAFTYLAFVAFLGLALRRIPMNLGQLAASAFFFRNYYSMGVERSWYTGHFWSLSVEEHFYLLWPALLILCSVNRRRFFAPALACGVAIWRAFDLHYAWVASIVPAWKGSVARTDYRLDGLLWGCALAFLWQSPRGRAWLTKACNPWSLAVLVLAIVLLLRIQPDGSSAAMAFLFPLCLACTVAHPGSRLSRLLEARPVAWTGRISYSLYLWQQLFLPASGVHAPFGVWQTFPFNLVLSVGAAAASYYFIERPLIAWGRRFVSPTARVETQVTEEYAVVTQS